MPVAPESDVGVAARWPEHRIHQVLGKDVAKFLQDKAYERRKQGAEQIETRVSAWAESGNPDGKEIQDIIDCLHDMYVRNSSSSNFRKGGLIALASTAIALNKDHISPFLSSLVRPVLLLFDDQEARVKYYACESMYNIAKVAKVKILPFLTGIFEGICKLYADVDTEVKNGSQFLDRLVKDIVTDEHGEFDVAQFVPQLAKRADAKNPHCRQLVLSWIMVLNDIKSIDMLDHLPLLIRGLFDMLSDSARDVVANADTMLSEFLNEIREVSPEKQRRVIAATASSVVARAERSRTCSDNDNFERLTALCWVRDYVSIELKLSQHARDKLESVEDPQPPFADQLSNLLGAVLECVEAKEEEIQKMATEVQASLQEMVRQSAWPFPIDDVVAVLLKSLERESVMLRTACLQWVCMLLERFEEPMEPLLQDLLEPIFKILKHQEQDFVIAALQVLALMTKHRDYFQAVSKQLIQLFRQDRKMLDVKGRLIIRRLLAHLDVKKFFRFMAQNIGPESGGDLEFCDQLVQLLNWILLTSKETRAVREELLMDREEAHELLHALLIPWFHNPVSTLSLCLFVQKYELAHQLLLRFAAFEPTVEFLIQLDQLVHLLESPIFARVRMQLFEPRKHPFLVKCMLGLAMLLPQTNAFNILKGRIQLVHSGLLLDSLHQGEPAATTSAGERKKMQEHLDNFDSAVVAKELYNSSVDRKAFPDDALRERDDRPFNPPSR